MSAILTNPYAARHAVQTWPDPGIDDHRRFWIAIGGQDGDEARDEDTVNWYETQPTRQRDRKDRAVDPWLTKEHWLCGNRIKRGWRGNVTKTVSAILCKSRVENPKSSVKILYRRTYVYCYSVRSFFFFDTPTIMPDGDENPCGVEKKTKKRPKKSESRMFPVVFRRATSIQRCSPRLIPFPALHVLFVRRAGGN